jgi:hypothetical protein
MKKEILRENEINLSHDLSAKRDIKIDKRELHKWDDESFIWGNFKTA